MGVERRRQQWHFLSFFRFFFFFLFDCSLISLPAGLMPVSSSSFSCCFVRATVSYFLPRRVVLSVQQQLLTSSCCFVRATGILSVPLQHACCCSSCSLSFLIFLCCILQNTTSRLICFALFYLYQVFYFPPLFFYGLACFVVFSYPAR